METDSRAVKIIKDLISTLIIVAVVLGLGVALTGTWPFMVAVESGSMMPHLNPGDVVILLGLTRVNKVVTWSEGALTGYKSFGDFGDVIVYKPNGHGKPIIHRAIAYVHKGDNIPILLNGKLVLTNIKAEDEGYITQGDNKRTNKIPDQLAPSFLSPTGERIKPVKTDWIVGVAKFKIPYLGYVRLLIPI